MRTFGQDLRFALRILSGSPGFAVVAVLTLALGIAASTTVFSWIDALLWHPFPGTARSGELAVLEMCDASAPNGGTSVSWLDFTDYRARLTLASGPVLQRYVSFSLGEEESARPAWGELVSANYFELLGVAPLLGRMFTPGAESDTPGAYPALVISERLWRGYFRADPKIVGQSIRVNRRLLTIVGVAPGRFRGTAPAMLLDIWVPASMTVALGLSDDGLFKDRSDRAFHSMLVRLKPGVTLARAQSEVAALAAGLSAAYPATNRRVGANVVPPWRAHSGTGDLLLSPLRALLAVSLLLLVIVCANVANLLLARSVVRSREFGVRLALGASGWRLARQLMAETLLLSFLGAFAALLLLPWMWGSLPALVPDIGIPIVRDFAFNGHIAAFAVLCCLLSTAGAGVVPALLTARADLNTILKRGGRSSISAGAGHTRRVLVIAEVALALVALVSAGLFARSFRNAAQIDNGMDTRSVLFARFFMQGSGYDAARQRDFADRLVRNLQARPGIQVVAYADVTPLATTAGPYARVEPQGYVGAPGESRDVNRALVSPGYFAALRIPLLSGRDFNDSDSTAAPWVAIVNQTFARRYFAGADPVGRRLRVQGKWTTIVGMARDSKYFHPAEAPRPFFYLAGRQVLGERLQEMDFFLRTVRDPLQAAPALRYAVASTDAALSSYHSLRLSEYTGIALFPQRVAASLLASLGLMCLFLAALGLYSVISCVVNQGTREIGLRMALGARAGDVTAMVIRQAMSLVLAGLLWGLAAAFAVTRLASGMLVGVSPSDPLTFAAAALFLIVVALAATLLPVRRATHVDPVIALRQP